ncbi:MAG: DNA mismatch repair protein MutS [Acidobacteria bacterium]|nr:DNA mismatch repair protein MutS [Acidobacteriota bacterium]
MPEASTPLMRQYNSIKQKYPQALLFFRLGDFYELFFEDAILAARELQITLTSRNKEKGVAVPMCGVPHHAADIYISRLIQKGHKVAVCEQVEDPRLAKKLVRREVTRVITPGTASDTRLLAPGENNYLVAACRSGERIGLACVDLSTGEFRATEMGGAGREAKLAEELSHLGARELLSPAGQPLFPEPEGRLAFAEPLSGPSRLTRTDLDEWVFGYEYALRMLTDHFHVHSLDGFGLEGKPQAVCASGALLHYLKETQQGTLAHLDRIRFYDRQEWMVLDSITVRNLELVEPLFAGEPEATLLSVIDRTATAMGARLLRSWMLRPSLGQSVMEARLDAVEQLLQQSMTRVRIAKEIASVYDLERLLSKVTMGTATPRDLAALRNSLAPLPALRSLVGSIASRRLRELWEQLDELADVHGQLEKALVESPPLNLKEGGVIREGHHAELDELRSLSRNAKQTIAQMEARERKQTGIGSLKIKFNDIFGYYIEVSRSNLPLVPERYERKQTLVNAERFTIGELKEYERKVLDAEDRMLEMEQGLFLELRAAVGEHAARIRRTAAAVAEVDVLVNFAGLAADYNYCRPQFSADGEFEIAAGRHPVLERLGESQQAERFVPNDLYMNAAGERIMILTGPNMGGKSTYLRQVALIAILGQMGSFVPAERACLPVFDRIFTRIGASDSLARGRSTFMVEMTETAVILNTVGPNSLVILDEIGRGTATYDGLAIAWAVVEYLHARTTAKTLFATHYHELTELADHLPSVKNQHVSVKESGSGIVFLRRVEPGKADRSYGIEVARLAALPAEVIERAREVLSYHEQSEHGLSDRLNPSAEPPGALQFTLFTPSNQAIMERLAGLDLDSLKPLDALNLLAELKKEIEKG